MRQQTQTASHFLSTKQNPNKIQSLDGPALDYSFKNIRTLAQLIQGTNYNYNDSMIKQQNKMGMTNTFSLSLSLQTNTPNHPKTHHAIVQVQKEIQEAVEPKLQIIRTIQTTDHNYLDTQQRKVHKKQKQQKIVKKVVNTITTSLFLRYNKLNSIQDFNKYVQPVFPTLYNNLMWIDLSHNRLIQLSEDFRLLKNLKTLYLHANLIYKFEQLQKISSSKQSKQSTLRTLTIHANPLQQYPQFRALIHSILPSLKKIDSTLVTKRETDRAVILRRGLKKYPQLKPAKRGQEVSDNQDDDS